MFDSSWTDQGWIKQRKWAMPTETYWQCSVHITFINFVKPRTKNYRVDQKLLNLGDEWHEVYHSNMQQNLWFCLSSLFRLREFKRKLLQILAYFAKPSRKKELGTTGVILLQNLKDVQRTTYTDEGNLVSKKWNILLLFLDEKFLIPE